MVPYSTTFFMYIRSMKTTSTLVVILLLTCFVHAQGTYENHWKTLNGDPTREEVEKMLNEIEEIARQKQGREDTEIENLLNYAGNVTAYKMQQFYLAARCYRILYDYRISNNSSLTLLIGSNMIAELERVEKIDIRLYEEKLKKAQEYLGEYLKTHPDNFDGLYNLGALYYNYIAYIQDHKIYDFDKNINAAKNAKINLVKALEIQPDNEDAKELLHSVNLILGVDSGHTDINFNEGK